MSYYIIKSYSKDITEENFMQEMMDLKDNRWLINYGMQLDESFDYINDSLFWDLLVE